MTTAQDSGSRGFIVVAVLWILAALSALALIYLSFVTSSAVMVGVSAARVQVEAAISGAVELAAYQLVTSTPEARPSSGTFNAKLGTSHVKVGFRSESARIDLNSAPRSLLVGLFISLGAQLAAAENYADRIIAWRTPAENAENDPENSAYRVSGSPYLPRHAPFPSADELWLVRGIPTQYVERVLPMVTVFSNLPSVNLIDAPAPVLAALPAMTPQRLQTILTSRNDPRTDPRTLLSLVGDDGVTLDAAKAYRLLIDVSLESGQRAGADVVILLGGNEEPYRVLSWRDDFDGGATVSQGISRR